MNYLQKYPDSVRLIKCDWCGHEKEDVRYFDIDTVCMDCLQGEVEEEQTYSGVQRERN